MKRLLTRLAGTVLLLSAIEPALAVTVSLEPVSQTIFTGDTATVNVNISGLSDSPPDNLISGFDLNITYDTSVLTFDSLDFGPLLGDPLLLEAATGIDTTVAGVVDFFELSFLADSALDALQPSSFTLATLTFIGNSVGSSELELDSSNVKLIGAMAEELSNPTLETANITVEPRDSQTTPEPSTLISTLLMLGLGGLYPLVKSAWFKKSYPSR